MTAPMVFLYTQSFFESGVVYIDINDPFYTRLRLGILKKKDVLTYGLLSKLHATISKLKLKGRNNTSVNHFRGFL